MRIILKIIYLVVMAVECYLLYRLAVIPLIPVLRNIIQNGVSLEVALNSAKVNGMRISSIQELITRSSLYIIAWSICVGLTGWIYRIARKFLL